MQITPHHRWALVAAAATSAIALTDAVTHGMTGRYSVFSDDSDLQTVAAAGGVVHGLTYVALAVVLVSEAGRFAAATRVTRWTRWVVLASLGVLAAGFLTLAPAIALLDAHHSPLASGFGLVAGPAFLGMILGSLVLGLTALWNRSLGIGGRLLALLLPVLAVTLLLAWLAPAWAHPAYLETTLHFGLALVGAGALAPQLATREAIASPISAV